MGAIVDEVAGEERLFQGVRPPPDPAAVPRGADGLPAATILTAKAVALAAAEATRQLQF